MFFVSSWHRSWNVTLVIVTVYQNNEYQNNEYQNNEYQNNEYRTMYNFLLIWLTMGMIIRMRVSN